MADPKNSPFAWKSGVRVLARLFPFYPKKLALLCFCLLGVTIGLQLLLPYFQREAIDYLADESPRTLEQTVNGLWIFAGWILGLQIIRAGFAWLLHIYRIQTIQRSLASLRAALFGRLQQISWRERSDHGAGDLIARVTRDVTRTRGFFVQFLFNAVEVLGLVGGSIVVILWIHPGLGLAVLAPIPLTVVMLFFFGTKARQNWRASNTTYGEAVSAMQENVAGVRVVRAFAKEEEEARRLVAHSDACKEAATLAGHYVVSRMPLTFLIVGTSLPIALGYGSHLIASGAISAGALIQVLLLLQTVMMRMRNVAQIVMAFQAAAASADRIFEILDRPIDISEPEEPKTIPVGALSITLSGIRFGYLEQRAILEGLHWKVAAGEWAAVVGKTGSGKSTLLRLMPRLLDPDEGQVQVADIDVQEISLPDLRRRVALLSQDPFFFSETIRENLKTANSEATDEEMEQALEVAHLAPFVKGLPEGLSTRIGERGVTLSGGQRQRLALARAILGGADVLLFDDALSNVDSRTERNILMALRRRLQQKTVIWTTHRMASIRAADRVVCLDGGRLTFDGAPNEFFNNPEQSREFLLAQRMSE